MFDKAKQKGASKHVGILPNIVPADSRERLSGGITLVFGPGSDGTRIAQLLMNLGEYPGLRVAITRGLAGKGSWADLDLREPVALYQALYRLPWVKELARKGNQIQVTLGPEGEPRNMAADGPAATMMP
jgi:hypothetical protein